MAGDEKSSRIIKILKQIAENLTQDEIVTLRTNIKKAIDISKATGEMRDETQLKEFLGKYVKMLQFRAGISVNLLKQSIRSLIMISENEALGNIVYEKFNEYILREHPTLSIGMDLDDDLLKAYFKALEAGSEDARHIRLMVVGMYGVGKTTLVNKILCKPNAEQEPPSTVGIDISVDACEVDENETWKMTYDFEEKESRYKIRLQQLFKSNAEQTTAMENSHSQQTHHVYVSDPNDVNMEMETEPKAIFPSTPVELDTEEYINKVKVEYASAENNGSLENKEYYKQMSVAHENSKRDEIAIKPTTVSVWDFAGQSVYYSTHHFFLNPRAIYLLVLDLSKDINGKVDEGTDKSGSENLHLGNSTEHFTRLDAFHFWLKSIYIYTQQRKHSHPNDDSEYVYKPTIILVGTHKDVLEKEGKDPTAEAKKYFKNALKAFGDSDMKSLIHEKTFVVSKLGTPEEFDELKAEIYQVAKGQPFWREKIPGKFIPLEREVEKKKNDKEEIMNYDELGGVSKKSHYPLPEEQINVFLKFQHAFGNLLYYDAANPDMVILRPQWIIDAFKLFVTHTGNKESKEWLEFSSMAKLTYGLIDECINPEEKKWYPFKAEIIRYMEHLDIIAKPVSFVEQVDDTANQTPKQLNVNKGKWTVKLPHGANQNEFINEDFYFMPCKLPARPSPEKLKEILSKNGISSQVLCMYIKDVFLPPFVFHRIMATCIKEMPILLHDDKYVLYNAIGAFKIEPTSVLTLWSWDNMIYFKITSYHRDKENRMKNADLVQVRENFRRLVVDAFKTDGKEYSKEVSISYYVTCPKCPERFPFDQKTDEDGFPLDQKCGLFLVEELQRVDDTICNPNRHHVTRFEGLSRWFSDIQPIDTDLCLQQKCDDEKFLADLAKEIDPSKIFCLTRELDFSDKERQRLEKVYGNHILTYIFHILFTMKKRGVILAVLQNATEAAGCPKETFYEILENTNDTVDKKVKEILDSIGDQAIEETVFDERLCQNVAEFVGLEYWLFGVYLGIAARRIELLHTSTSKADEIIKDIVIKWNNESGGKAKKECAYELIKAMVKSGGDLTCFSQVFIS